MAEAQQESRNREGRREPRGPGREGGDRRDDRERRGDRGDRRPEGPPEVDLEKLIADPLYLDNQAHGIVSRMRDMDSGTKSQLRRLYNAVRRATRAPENERQHDGQIIIKRLRVMMDVRDEAGEVVVYEKCRDEGEPVLAEDQPEPRD